MSRRSQLPQSIEYVSYFASLGAGAIVTWVVWELTSQPASYNSNNAKLELVQRSNEWFSLLIDNLPVIFIAIASMGAIAVTVYRSNYVR